MIGRPDWFAKKKYTGWGIRPKTWQGWVYILVAILVIIFIYYQPWWDWSLQVRRTVTLIWAGLFIADVLHIFFLISKQK